MQPPTPFVVVVVLFMLGLCCSLVHNEAQLSLVVFHNLWHLWASETKPNSNYYLAGREDTHTAVRRQKVPLISKSILKCSEKKERDGMMRPTTSNIRVSFFLKKMYIGTYLYYTHCWQQEIREKDWYFQASWLRQLCLMFLFCLFATTNQTNVAYSNRLQHRNLIEWKIYCIIIHSPNNRRDLFSGLSNY